jgi:hypothetical protein
MSLFGWISEETPKYDVLKTLSSTTELRRYSPQIRIRSTFANNPGYGFRPLARYIFGGNDQSKYIAMTAPVLQDQKEGHETMDFVMPSDMKLEQMPKPTDSMVQIIQVPEQDFIAIAFNGNPRSEELIKEKLQNVQRVASDESISIEESNYILAIYNPPWTIHYFRKNEILIPLKN